MKAAACRIVEKFRLHGYAAFFAGGWVRDYLLDRKPKDIDIATSAHPDEVVRLFPKSRPVGAQFGVIQVFLYGRTYEVATFRSDQEYQDGRHPSSVTFSGPEQDALRRDFTINGLFFDPANNSIVDYVGGQRDLEARLIRTIGDPGQRFSEDKLRMLRAIRFSCTLGFLIVPETWSAIRQLAPAILQVSWERIRDELRGIFTGPAPGQGLDLLYRSGMLKHILPEVESLQGVPRRLQSEPDQDLLTHAGHTLSVLRKPSLVLAFGALLHDVGKPQAIASGNPDMLKRHAELGEQITEKICRRLRMSTDETDRIVNLVAMHSLFGKVRQLRDSDFQRLLRRPDIKDHLELHRADRVSGRKDLSTYKYCIEKLRQFHGQPFPAALLNGEDLISMGYSPGPTFKEILRRIEDMQLEGTIRSREEAIAHVRKAFPPTPGIN